MADWDADDFDPDADGKLTAPRVTDKWDGEDEDNDINDAWDAESDVDKDDSKKKKTKVVKVKKKKTLQQKIAEKEKAAAKAREERLAREEEERQLNTPEGKLAEIMRNEITKAGGRKRFEIGSRNDGIGFFWRRRRIH